MTEHANPCSKCKKEPTIAKMAGLWYVQCLPCERIEVNPKREKAIQNWNAQNEQAKKYTNLTKWRGPDKVGLVPVFRLNIMGKRVKKYRSAAALARELGYITRALESKFARSKTGIVEIEGIRYVRDRTEATPARAGRGSKKQTEGQ